MHRILLTSIATLIALSACSGSEPRITMGEGLQRFQPEELSAAAGTTVSFTNDTAEPHTVTAYGDGLPDGSDYFSSGGAESEDAARDSVANELIEPGDTYEVTFDEPGRYRYFCIPHEEAGMKGTVVVE